MSNMITPGAIPSAAVVCAENIALLYLLHSVPALPSHNPIARHHFPQKNYTLSLMRERNLVGTLAFLSNLKDGPEHIPAVCIEEEPESASLSVFFAVNKSKPSDGEEVLQELKSGFEEIFALLSQVSDGHGTSDMEHKLFTAIISMCSVRILCRLRFIPNIRNTSRQPVKELFQEAITCIRQLENGTFQRSKLLPKCVMFVDRAREVIKSVDAWVNHRTPIRLGELVEGMYRLWEVGEIHGLVNAIPNRDMAPSARKNLLNIISKVARYREAARFLYRTAKKNPLARRMKVILVSLPQPAFQKTPADAFTSILPSTISRISGLHGQRYNVGHVCRLLNVNEAEASNQFVQQTRKTLKEANIHAEIQLLLYCDLKAPKLPPRIVCSTKDACFLCNAFFLMHGKYHIPRCHGRLYPGWRLPASPRLQELEQRFNNVLANHLRSSFKTLVSRQKKTIYPDPNESTLLTIPISLSTLRSLTSTESISEDEERILQPKTPDGIELGKASSFLSQYTARSEISKVTSSADPAGGTSDVRIQSSNDAASETIPPTPSNYQELSSDSISVNECALIQGQELSKSIKNRRTSPLYIAGPLEVQIEYSTAPNSTASDSQPVNLSYSIEWLTVDEARRLLETEPSSVHNAESLEIEVSHDIGDLKCIYVAARGAILKILLQPSITGSGSAMSYN